MHGNSTTDQRRAGGGAGRPFVTGVTGSSGSPAVCYPTAGSAEAAAVMYQRGNIPLYTLSASTPASGSGGGGGGGGGGYVGVVTRKNSYTGSQPTANGGAGGLKSGTGTDGNAGSAGTVVVLTV